jgi:hypothetical protein
MKSKRFATILGSLALAALPSLSHALLEVTLDSGLGTQTFTDMDDNGEVDFDVTVDGIFQAKGTAKADLDPLKGKIALAPLFPNPAAIFRNLSASPQTFTITVKSPTAVDAIAAPLGWDIFYYATVDDVIDMSVDVPTHSVAAKLNAGAITLGTLNGPALTSITNVEEELHGVDPANGFSTDVWLVWTISLGANDEFRVGSDNGFEGDSIQVNVFNQTQKCIDKMNNNARKVGDAAQKSDAKCTKEDGMDVTTCVDNPADEKTVKKIDKLTGDFLAFCSVVPAWGVNGDLCCVGGPGPGDLCTDSLMCGGGTCEGGGCIAAATDGAANDLTHDLFGGTVVISADKITAKCQEAATKALGKLYAGHWKAFRSCKKDNFATITDDLLLRSTCLEPEPDPDAKIAKLETKLSDSFQKKCLDKGLTGLGALFPGACSAEADGAFGACATRQAACRFCVSANEADAIVPPVDCDLFDDAIANTTCP